MEGSLPSSSKASESYTRSSVLCQKTREEGMNLEDCVGPDLIHLHFTVGNSVTGQYVLEEEEKNRQVRATETLGCVQWSGRQYNRV